MIQRVARKSIIVTKDSSRGSAFFKDFPVVGQTPKKAPSPLPHAIQILAINYICKIKFIGAIVVFSLIIQATQNCILQCTVSNEYKHFLQSTFLIKVNSPQLTVFCFFKLNRRTLLSVHYLSKM